jgi:hypothetical protein
LNCKFAPCLSDGKKSIQGNRHRRLHFFKSSDLSNTEETRNSSTTTTIENPDSIGGESLLSAVKTNQKQSAQSRIGTFIQALKKTNKRPTRQEQRLVQRLEQSLQQFSPETLRPLRELHHKIPDHHSILHDSLHEAINQGHTRLKYARTGANFLTNVLPVQVHDQHYAKANYSKAKEMEKKQSQEEKIYQLRHLINGCGGSVGKGDLSTSKNSQEFDTPHKIVLIHEQLKEEKKRLEEEQKAQLYLPYTTRSPRKLSPMKGRSMQSSAPLHTIQEAHLKAMEQKITKNKTMSLRLSLSSIPTQRQPQHRIFSSQPQPDDIFGISVSGIAKKSDSDSGRGGCGGNTIDRLYGIVDALEEVKIQRSKDLHTVLKVLEEGRQECLYFKFCHIEMDHVFASQNVQHMRQLSEKERQKIALQNIHKNRQWYEQLIHVLITKQQQQQQQQQQSTNTGVGSSGNGSSSSSSNHHHQQQRIPPMVFYFVETLRQLIEKGHLIEKNLLFQMILQCTHEDLSSQHVLTQEVFKFLRQQLNISISEWQHFFQSNGLPEPLE